VCACQSLNFGRNILSISLTVVSIRDIGRICISCFLREKFVVDSEQFSRVCRVTEFLAEGCSPGLENLVVEETPMFVAETTGAWTFSQTATDES